MKHSTTPSDMLADPLIGQTIGGKYTISRRIGQGGVGLVYLARQLDPAREVVVKVLAPHWERDAEALARFDREAKRLAGLQHPNIVEMFDHGHDRGRSYLVMEHLEGELLSDLVARKKRLSVEEFVPIAAQILKGIGHAHLREMMVRDVKPANIMLCQRKGRANFVKILDFGLAKLLRGEHPITEEHVMGTVGYLAPEAIKGEPLDLRVDVYAIGVLFWYMLAGKLPFDGESNAAVFYKTIHEATPDLNEVLGEGHTVPSGLVELIVACMEKDRAKRPSDADQIVERLIDVVPASMFRLPRSTDRSMPALGLAPSAGNSGMVDLLDRHGSETALDGSMATPPTGTMRPISSPHAVAGATGPIATMHVDSGPVASPRTVGLVAISVLTGALLAILVVGGVLLLLDRDDPGAPVTANDGDGDREGDAQRPMLLVKLDEVDGQIGSGQLDAAATALDRVRGAANADPSLRARVERLDQRILVERLVATAKKFEAEGDIAGAVTAYRDALQADPAHEVSRAALSRLSAKPADDPAGATADYGLVEIQTRPMANLHVDGAPLGTTPFKGKLPVGRHEIRLSARGYNPWMGSLEVTADGALPLSVQLRGKGPGQKDSGRGERPSASPPSTAPVPDRPVPAADPTPPPVDKPAAKDEDPFLPTPKTSGSGGKDGDPFLPTGKHP